MWCGVRGGQCDLHYQLQQFRIDKQICFMCRALLPSRTLSRCGARLSSRTLSRSDFVNGLSPGRTLSMASLSSDGLSTDQSTEPQPSQPAQPVQASQPLALMFLTCNICRYRQWLSLPSNSEHYRRFCLAECPPAKCERCCSCVRCRIRHDTKNYLNATDCNFNSISGDSASPQYQ